MCCLCVFRVCVYQGRRQSTAGEQSAALTSPRPFNLRSEERGKAKQALLAQRLEDKRRQASQRWGHSYTLKGVFFLAPCNMTRCISLAGNVGNACRDRATFGYPGFRNPVSKFGWHSNIWKMTIGSYVSWPAKIQHYPSRYCWGMMSIVGRQRHMFSFVYPFIYTHSEVYFIEDAWSVIQRCGM